MLQLYSYYRSPSAYRVRVALALKNLPYAQHSVHLTRQGGEQNTPAYRKINPQGLVPTLIDGDMILTQSLAIIEYLDETRPLPALMPADPRQRAYVRQIAHILSADIHPLTTLRVRNYLAGEVGAAQAQKTAWHHHWARQGFDAVEKLLEHSPFRTGAFSCGAQVTMADICLVAQAYDARRHDLSLSAWPLIEAIEKECLALPAFAEAAPENQPDAPEDQRPQVSKGRA